MVFVLAVRAAFSPDASTSSGLGRFFAVSRYVPSSILDRRIASSHSSPTSLTAAAMDPTVAPGACDAVTAFR